MILKQHYRYKIFKSAIKKNTQQIGCFKQLFLRSFFFTIITLQGRTYTPLHLSISTSVYGINLQFVSPIPLVQWWRALTSLIRSRDWFIIYRPKSGFWWHYQKLQMTLPINFFYQGYILLKFSRFYDLSNLKN